MSRRALFLTAALAFAGALAGCTNPTEVSDNEDVYNAPDRQCPTPPTGAVVTTPQEDASGNIDESGTEGCPGGVGDSINVDSREE